MRLILQCISGIYIVLKNLTYFVLPSAGVFPVILTLNLNISESVKVAFGLSLKYCHKRSMFLNNYRCILLN